MSSIEKFISPYIEQQFPAFYRSEGPNFIAFVRAYYEWLEGSQQAIGHSRSLLDYRDIDSTSDQFIQYLQNEFMSNFPKDIVADKRLLLKHITDLYRAKGSKRAYELLFRLLYGEDVDLFYPGEYVFKLSDNTWYVPRYLEVTTGTNLDKLINTKIQTVGATATALVDSVNSRYINNKLITIIEISQITGQFNVGDTIFQSDLSFITPETGIRVLGSLESVIVTAGGTDYIVGDILDVVGAGVEGKVRVSQISNNFLGSVSFAIIDGGSGYTLNSLVTVLPTLNLDITALQGNIPENTVVTNQSNTASGVVHFANTSLVQLINFANADLFVVGQNVIGPSGNAIIQRVYGGTGSNASFRVASISNRELLSFNSTQIIDYLSLQLDQDNDSFNLEISAVSGTFNANDTVSSSANVLFLEGVTISNNVVSGENLSNTSLNINNLYVYRSDGNLIYCTGPESDLLNANLVAGTVLVSNTTNSLFELTIAPIKQQINSTAIVSSSNSISLILSNVNGYFVQSTTVTSANSGATATIDNVIRLTDWNFANSSVLLDNLDSTIQDTLPISTIEVGTIESITGINPGIGYFTRPVVRVTEPDITNLLIFDSQNRLVGNNAIIAASLVGGNGTITTVDLFNSGYGYRDGQTVTLQLLNNPTEVIGSVILGGTGKSEGKWLNRKSFTSDIMKLHDNLFYQDYSYQIISQRMLKSYENLVRNLIHPSGLALFGTYRLDRIIEDDQDIIVETTITQTV
jgi:hypothetical protein